MAQRLSSRPLASPPRLWLAAVNGHLRHYPEEPLNPIDEPEAPLEVEFVGLTDAEQRAALAAFPGGRRFVLKDRN
jgi:hypothetical protein